jgi:Response regulators consisting of a CheY-like receiver domain and a winged-helix DNA-binding domain
VVDDEAPLRELIIVTLGDTFRCEEAADGETALAQLREAPPDLVFLDLMLPDCSGIDVLREMRADPILRNVAVVVVSAWQRPEDVTLALENGADRFLAKPFLVDELASVAQGLVERQG